MKRKDIQKAIAEAKANNKKVREKVVVFENILSFIFDISDRERCDYYDAVLLYICYGIVPNFAALSPTKAQQFRLLFSLLKKQRIGWENACKSDTSENLPPDPTPDPTPDQVYKDKKIRSIEDIKKEEPPIIPPCNERVGFEFFGTFKNVELKPAELRKLQMDFGEDETQSAIDDLSCKLIDGSTESNAHYATLTYWLANRRKKKLREKEKDDHYKGDDTIGKNFVRRGID